MFHRMLVAALMGLPFILAACSNTPHTPLKQDFQLATSQVHWVRLKDWQAADAKCRTLERAATGHDYAIPAGGHVGGCAVFDRQTASCTIYAPAPGWIEDEAGMAILGHEFLHCMTGNFH